MMACSIYSVLPDHNMYFQTKLFMPYSNIPTQALVWAVNVSSIPCAVGSKQLLLNMSKPTTVNLSYIC